MAEKTVRELKTREPGEGIRRRKEGTAEIRPSLLSENIVGQIRFIALDQLVPFSKQARQSFDEQDIQTLAETIKEYGIRQPLTVLQREEDLTTFEIVSGERRYRAAHLLGLPKVPCIILTDSRQAEEIALIENIQRTDLTPLELGVGYAQLIASGRFRNAEEIAEKLGVSRSQVFEYIQYARFPEFIKEALCDRNILRSKDITRVFLRRLKECDSDAQMITFIANTYKAAKAASLTSSDEEGESTLVPFPPSLGEGGNQTNALLDVKWQDFVKKKRDRRRMTLMSISLENGDLRPQLRGLKVCPKYLLPQIRLLLQDVIREIEEG